MPALSDQGVAAQQDVAFLHIRSMNVLNKRQGRRIFVI
jgi:hypothetical protein